MLMSIEIEGEEYLTATEAAHFLKVAPATFAKFRKDHHSQWMTRPGLGQRKFFKKKDLEEFLKFRPGEEKEE